MFARYAQEVPDNLSELLVEQPRPTTYVVRGSRYVAPNLLAEDGTIGLRVVQGDEFCRKLLRRLGHGIVSTSANISGEPAPAIYKEVDGAIIKAVDYVVGWRQNDETKSAPSRVVRVLPDGSLETLRE
jgi:L-threonylcarbamoyladenylate synthase